jgi:CBS domain-containing protein
LALVYAVRHVASKPLIMVKHDELAHTAIDIMVKNDIGALVVTDEGRPVGILTKRDVLKNCCGDASCRRTTVARIMSKPLLTIDIEAPIGQAAGLMMERNVRRLLVTEDGRIVGIVTQKDLLRGTLQAFHSLLWSTV